MRTRTLLLTGLVGTAAAAAVTTTVVDVDRQPWDEVEVDGATVRVRYVGSECEDGRWARASETDAAVTVRVWTVRRASSCSDVGVARQAEVTLDEPLGGRRLVDGSR